MEDGGHGKRHDGKNGKREEDRERKPVSEQQEAVQMTRE